MGARKYAVEELKGKTIKGMTLLEPRGMTEKGERLWFCVCNNCSKTVIKREIKLSQGCSSCKHIRARFDPATR